MQEDHLPPFKLRLQQWLADGGGMKPVLSRNIEPANKAKRERAKSAPRIPKPKPQRPERQPSATCPVCGRTFEGRAASLPGRPRQFCSNSCKRDHEMNRRRHRDSGRKLAMIPASDVPMTRKPIPLSELSGHFVGSGGPGITNENGEPVPARFGVGIIFNCPIGCGIQHYIPFDTAIGDGLPTPAAQERHAWVREGDTIETLTLTPSIRSDPAKGGCGFHGFIKAGMVTFCDDTPDKHQRTP